jgi:hypothetical protein
MIRGVNPGGGEIFRTCPDRPWGPPSLLHNSYRVFPGVKSGWGMTLTPHPLLVPWLRKGKAIPLFPLWAARPVQSLSACTRVHFTFYAFYLKNVRGNFYKSCTKPNVQHTAQWCNPKAGAILCTVTTWASLNVTETCSETNVCKDHCNNIYIYIYIYI